MYLFNVCPQTCICAFITFSNTEKGLLFLSGQEEYTSNFSKVIHTKLTQTKPLMVTDLEVLLGQTGH